MNMQIKSRYLFIKCDGRKKITDIGLIRRMSL